MGESTVRRRRSALATLAGSSATTVVAGLQSLVLLPLYLDVLGPRLYGAWLATGEVLVWMLALDFGIPNLLIQRTGASLAAGDKKSIGAHFSASALVLTAVAAVLCAVAWFAAPLVSGLFGVGDSGLAGALRLGAIAVSISIVANALVGLSRGLQDTSLVQGFVFVGTVLGFGVTAWMMMAGFGLESIAYGLLARAAATMAGGLVFLWVRVDRAILGAVRPTSAAFQDIGRHCPSLFAAGLSYALMNNSMVTLAALMFRPETAAVVGITRKAADLARGVLDMIGHASYGGFAHLFAERDAPKSARVYRELVATYFVAAVALLSAYVAVNSTFIANWVGSEMFGGFALTAALAVATALGGWSYLQASLLRSIGLHRDSSRVLLVECGSRLGLMVVLAYAIGPIGLALATCVTAIFAGVWASRRVWTEIGAQEGSSRAIWMWRVAPFVVGSAFGCWGALGGWTHVVVIGLAVALAAVVSLLHTDPALSAIRSLFSNRFQRGAV